MSTELILYFTITFLLSSGVITILVREFLRRQRNKKERIEDFQPEINRLTILLGELAERIDDRWNRQWEIAMTGYETAASQEQIQELEEGVESVIGISKDVGRVGRELVRSLERFEADFQDNGDAVAEKRARDTLLREGTSPEETDDLEYFELTENRRYHAWADHLFELDDLIGIIASCLLPFTRRSDTRSDLTELSKRGGISRIAGQALSSIPSLPEEAGLRSWWKRYIIRRETQRVSKKLIDEYREQNPMPQFVPEKKSLLKRLWTRLQNGI